MNEIVTKIIKLMEVNGVNAHQLEQAAQLANATIKNWKNGRNKPSLEAVVKIADYFNVSVDSLIGRNTPEASFQKFTKSGKKDNIKTSPHFVAFIDLLGTQAIMKNRENNLLNHMAEITKIAYDLVFQNNSLKDIKGSLGTRIFSDNIVMYIPVNKNDYAIALQALCMYVGFFQYLLLKLYGYYVRGGLAIGDFFANDDFIYGQALNDAYNIESKLAIYPRIVVSNQIIEQISLYNLEKFFWGENGCLVFCRFDGCHYINYLDNHSSDEIRQVLDIVNKSITDSIKNEKEKQREKNSTETFHYDYNIGFERILQKYKQVQNFIQVRYASLMTQELNMKKYTINAPATLINGDNSPIIDSHIEQTNMHYNDESFSELLYVWNQLNESQKKQIILMAKSFLLDK